MKIKGDFYEGELKTKENGEMFLEIWLSKDIKKHMGICKRTKNQRIFNKNLKKITELLGGRVCA